MLRRFYFFVVEVLFFLLFLGVLILSGRIAF